jgi:chemotaxis protein MotB
MLLAQTELIEKQAKITKLNFEILSKQKSLDSINALLDYRKNENLRLERKLAQKDSVLEDLKSNISKKLNKTDLDGVFLTVDGGLLRITLKDTLLFETGKYTITKEGAEVINKITNILLHYKKYNVLVIGHTDNKAIKAHSNVKDNLDLSTARANAVTRLILSNKEMDGGRILSAGRGEYSPIAENKNESGRQKNRRVEVLLIPEKSIF